MHVCPIVPNFRCIQRDLLDMSTSRRFLPGTSYCIVQEMCRLPAPSLAAKCRISRFRQILHDKKHELFQGFLNQTKRYCKDMNIPKMYLCTQKAVLKAKYTDAQLSKIRPTSRKPFQMCEEANSPPYTSAHPLRACLPAKLRITNYLH